MVRHYFLIFLLHLSTTIYAQQNVMVNGYPETVYSINQDIPVPDNFTPLTSFFQSKEIVGMGEATHGTHEFFSTKVELFKFLVNTCNFRVFGIEASYGAQLYVNEYVKEGVGDIQEIMHYLDWPWSTEEVRDLVEWIRMYNLDKDENDKISFYGFDCQNIAVGIKYLNRFFQNDSSGYVQEFENITPLLSGNSEFDLFQLIKNDRQKIKDSLYNTNKLLLEWIQMNEASITKKYGEKEFDRIHLCIENFSQSLGFIFEGYKTMHFRDSCMAYNVLKIHEIEQNKMFIWAHNGHIGKEYSKIPIMGTYIKGVLNEKYYAIGFAFDHGNFMAWKGPNTIAGAVFKFLFNRNTLYQGLMECSAATNTKNTLTNELKKTDLPSFFIDVHSTANPLFLTPQTYYDIGASYLNNRHASRKIIVSDEFDGLIFFNFTSATKVLNN